jgi:thiamine biosynthesis lipoprotein
VKVSGFIIFGIVLLTSPQFGFGQVFNNPDQAFLTASQSKRPLLLIFSGSDWCLPCERLNKLIFSDSAFKNFANQKLVLIEADFPQKAKLSKDQISCNEKLAEEFNPGGIFPYLLLLNADRTIITGLDYIHYNSAHFIEEIKNAIALYGK